MKNHSERIKENKKDFDRNCQLAARKILIETAQLAARKVVS